MASLIKQSGRYYAQFYSATRKPQRKKVSLKVTTKGKAQSILRSLEESYAAGEFDPWKHSPQDFLHGRSGLQTGVRLEDAKQRFLESRRRRGHTENTVRTYKGNIRRLMKRVGPSTPVENLTPESVDEYVRAKGISRATQNKRFRMIRAFLNWCKREELISEAPTERLDPPAAPDRMPKPISPGDLENLLATIQTDYAKKREAGLCKEGEIIWLTGLIRWAAITGMRFSECGRLRHKHVDTQRGLILIYRQKSRQEGTIPLSKAARDIYKDCGGQPDHYVFKAPKADPSQRNVGHWIRNTGRKFKRYREKAGLPDHITFHSLRHTFCTRLAEAGKNAATIQRLARHADIKTSQRYIELSSQHLQQELDSVFG